MLKIFNTLTREKEVFKPIHEGKVGMYVCGVTVYDLCHIGHGRTFVCFDVIARYLRALGYDLTYVRNITDVDDKIIKRALENKETCDQLVDRMVQEMYKDFDALNVLLQNIYNPRSKMREEITYGDIIYRENDKVIQLVNDLDNNVFNGDVGFIESIYNNKIIIDFDGNKVEYSKKDLKEIKHAYAITIHKSQGSEFMHVLMPISSSYYRMLYNKLIYTGVSRAKKSLTLIGDPKTFMQAVNNNYSSYRKTSLKEKIIMVYNNK